MTKQKERKNNDETLLWERAWLRRKRNWQKTTTTTKKNDRSWESNKIKNYFVFCSLHHDTKQVEIIYNNKKWRNTKKALYTWCFATCRFLFVCMIFTFVFIFQFCFNEFICFLLVVFSCCCNCDVEPHSLNHNQKGYW